ncbi:MAG TPA: riboflavin synthase [Candidatus Cloacimonadota bacterium]|nr:riboflavin synthase [Candidatus Cloacimonadota bacterium]
MFTGIIEAVKPVHAVFPYAGNTSITIAKPDFFTDLKIGCSVACNGICLTVIDIKPDVFTVECMRETQIKTTAGKWQTGSKINLERALQIGSRLDGHWVQGHVDKTAPLLATKTTNSTLYLTFALPSEDKALLVPQGSIAINGVSLTVAELHSERFTVALIGHTLENTNLADLKIGERVNLEYDILGKYILRGKQVTELSQEFLREQGF